MTDPASLLSSYESKLPQTRDTGRLQALLDLAAGHHVSHDASIALLLDAHALAVTLCEHLHAARIALKLARLHTGEAALHWARTAHAHHEHLHDENGEVRSLLLQAQLLAGQPAAALPCVLRAAYVAHEAGHADMESEALQEAASLYARLGSDPNAAASLQGALDVQGHASTPHERVPLLLTVGQARLRAHQPKEAIGAFREAVKSTPGVDTIQHADAFAGIGEAMLQQGQPDRSVAFFERAEQIATRENDTARRVHFLGLHARGHALVGNEARATELFDACLALAEAHPDTPQAAEAVLRAAEHDALQGRHARARTTLARLVDATGDVQRERHRLLAEIDRAQGELTAALEAQQTLMKLERAAQEAAHEQERAVLEAQHEAELELAVRRERRTAARLQSVVLAEKAELLQQLDQLRQAAGTGGGGIGKDAVTGAYTRQHGLQLLTRDFKRSVRAKTDLSVAVLGIDAPFGGATDPAGVDVTRVLAAVTQVMFDSVRDTDIVARFSAHEFMIVFPETKADGAHTVLQRILSSVQQLDWQACGLREPLTLSAGLCTRGFVQGAQLLVNTAHEHYYRSRRDGGNQISTAE